MKLDLFERVKSTSFNKVDRVEVDLEEAKKETLEELDYLDSDLTFEDPVGLKLGFINVVVERKDLQETCDIADDAIYIYNIAFESGEDYLSGYEYFLELAEDKNFKFLITYFD